MISVSVKQVSTYIPFDEFQDIHKLRECIIKLEENDIFSYDYKSVIAHDGKELHRLYVKKNVYLDANKVINAYNKEQREKCQQRMNTLINNAYN